PGPASHPRPGGPPRRGQEARSLSKGKLWGGRFQKPLLPALERFSSSLEVDLELAPYDVAGSIGHARGLLEAGLLTKAGFNRLHRALVQVGKEIESGQFVFADSDEDIHTAVERRLAEIDPDGASRLHAGRSRNDQVALDLRLYCRAAASAIAEELAQLLAAVAAQAKRHSSLAMPGYTHLQRAQPVTVGHHLLAHAQPLLRDSARVMNAYLSASEMPLGSGALAGTTLPLDRIAAADALGFERLTKNSMDAVADRDFALDLVYACLSIGLHLSRFGEDVVLWASTEFGFLKLADEVATGSSIMPQKRNPDVAELIRGRSGRALASLVGLATVLKGLPLAYDRDLQEDKRHLFGAVDNCLECLEAARLLVERLEFDKRRLAEAVADPELLATDSAEKLVADGRAFREVHGEVGRSLREGRHQQPWDVAESLRRRSLPGGPEPAQVKAAAETVGHQAKALTDWARGNS
ncbi:MAG: argininosuccinate lyase, partial [Candidatus Dormibacteraeota bacterium]|nr:argininosuccinate lyase [Candidatus Dormibacteraeota bacterium]